MTASTRRRARHLVQVLEHDGARRRSTDESRQLELCQIMWWMRHVVLALGLVVSFGGPRRTSVVIAVALVAECVGHVVVRARASRAFTVTVLDAVLLVGLAAIGLPPLLTLVVAVGVLGWAATFRPLGAAASGAVALTAVGTSWALHREHFTATHTLAAFALLGMIFLARTIRMNMGARRASEREGLVADGIDAIIWEAVGSPCALKVSKAAERVLGHPVAAWTVPDFLCSIVHPADEHVLRRQMSGEGDGSVTVRLRHADGSYRWMENRCNWVSDRSGRTRFAVGVLIDRTDQIAAERESMTFGQLVASSPIGQVLVRCAADGDPVVEAMNHAAREIFGADASAVGSTLGHLGRRGADVEVLLHLVASGVTDQPTEICGVDGRVHQASMRRIDDETCSIDFLDVTERVRAGELLHAQARQDHLTGLANRRSFIECLEMRVASGLEPTVVIIDLDDFKDINDSLGHETGDRLLQEIGGRIASACGPEDVVARLGGDEFAMILAERSSVACVRRAAYLVDQIHQPVLVDELRLRVRASAGLATWDLLADEHTGEELVRCADVAMYEAKRRGGGALLYETGSDRFDRQRLALVSELETAIAADQLVLHHQPVVDVATRRVVGTEVLARWQHPELGLVPPNIFIELAEVSGQMRNLTRWAIRRALDDLVTLGPGHDDMEVSVNLSVRNLYEADLCDWLGSLLDELGIPGRRLVVELTESTMMDDQSAAIEVIERLRGLGVRTWIDDFGTGHSSFARLRTLPVDGVKIDRTFVRGATETSSDLVLLRSIVELLHGLGLTAVAEGVEQLSTLTALDELGCDRAQGFAIARPMPLERLREWLAAADEHLQVMSHH